jgi:hypothetical protein
VLCAAVGRFRSAAVASTQVATLALAIGAGVGASASYGARSGEVPLRAHGKNASPEFRFGPLAEE